MLILLTILLFIFVPLAMSILKLIWPRFSIQGFLSVLTVLAGWPMVFLAREDIPKTITFLVWQPVPFFPTSPTLLVDNISWFFALALVSLSLAVIITSIAQLGHSFSPPAREKIEVVEIQGSADPALPQKEPAQSNVLGLAPSWQTWAGILVLTSLGLVAVTSGNMLTLLMAWAALDMMELVILLGQVMQSKAREQIILAFTARMAGIGMALLAGIIPWSQGKSLTFEVIDQSTSIYLILAAGLRLGVLPIHLPLLQDLPLRRGLGTVLRLVPAAASYILLVRVANLGVLGSATPYLLALTALAGLYAGINWLGARDELDGRPYWLIGTAAMAIASAILNRPIACLAWSIASLLSGGMVFSLSIRHKNLFPIITLGLINFSALPFSPTWLGTTLYQYNQSISGFINPPVFYILSLAWLSIHSFLLAGLFRHGLRDMYATAGQKAEHIERWVWFLYPIGLIFITVTHFLIGLLLQPNFKEMHLTAWIMGLVTVILSAAIIYFPRRNIFVPHANRSIKHSTLNRFLSLNWFYGFLWNAYRLMARLISMISTILEGEGGILWALVLFALIFVFLQK